MWLACATQEEIAEAVGVPRQTIDDWTKDFAESPEDGLPAFPPGFEPPIYNVWKQQTIDDWTKDFTQTCQEQERVIPPGFEPPIYNVWKQMWLACATQEEVAEAISIDRATASRWEEGFAESCLAQDSPFPPGFEPPIYNVWKQQTKSNTLADDGKCAVDCAFENRSATRISCSVHLGRHPNFALTQAMNCPWGTSWRGLDRWPRFPVSGPRFQRQLINRVPHLATGPCQPVKQLTTRGQGGHHQHGGTVPADPQGFACGRVA